MTQFFRGNLAGLTIRSGKLADKKVIDCLYTCKEGLDLQVPEDGGRGVQVRARLTSLLAWSAKSGDAGKGRNGVKGFFGPVIRDRVSRCSPGCPGSVDQAGFRDPSAS